MKPRQVQFGLMSLALPSPSGIRDARARIAGHVIRSPLVPWGGDEGGNRIYLKLENLQPGGSFKVRAGANALLALDEAERKAGIYTASVGNFALGVLIAGQNIDCPVKVYVPANAAKKKISALRGLGAEVAQVDFADWWKIMEDHGRAGEPGRFLHPVADQKVHEGNATIGLEIIEDLPDTDCIMVPFGGGGLITGIGTAAKSRRPEVRMFGCESEAATPLSAALEAGRPLRVPFDQETFIDGIGSTAVLEIMWPLVREIVDRAVVVPTEAAGRAVADLVKSNAIIAEGAGGVALAAARTLPDRGLNIVAVISGGNLGLDVVADLVRRYA
jgi:threonine dehydratase